MNVVSSDFKSHPATITSENAPPPDAPAGFPPTPYKRKKNRNVEEIRAEGLYLWEVTKHYLFRPGVVGGLVGIINIGLIAGTARAFYTQPHLRRDTKVLSATAAATLALLSVEGYGAEKYSQTARGQAEARRAKEEGSLIYRHLQEAILRPGVLGGLVGLCELSIGLFLLV